MILSSLGIDLGGTKISFGILTEDGQLTETDTYAVDEMLYQKEPEKAFLNHLTQYLTQKEIQQKYKLQNIGIGLPGIVDHESGEVIYSSTFHWNHVPLGKIVTNATGVQCFVENDANCAALGEVRFGSAKGKRECGNDYARDRCRLRNHYSGQYFRRGEISGRGIWPYNIYLWRASL